MALYGTSTEYVLHSLLWLVDNPASISSMDLAELQNIPAALMAKILPKLEKAGILQSSEGVRGGYKLARPPEDICVLDVVEAVEGRKTVFNCQEIRERCILFSEQPPAWASQGVCSIHAVMLRAEQAMRAELAKTSLADLVLTVKNKAPDVFLDEVQSWFDERIEMRRARKSKT
ncbi:RrF2 family transcriptional regulator [Swingsia samuiensis]|uniref:Rrf2 family transcriptional regulator n=1 Tax=Swingsia samuiensis TaxID=1293412 RepID=A0A4Y6UIR3_9PROT|nr:Rrf2 family transcriptional regulator [Swingsia samuiensis]QDH16508.1 Rrf2 family transcriptional regulator [Swingsia samuiensis]